MSARRALLLAAMLLAAVAIAALPAAARKGPMPEGGWSLIKDVSDPHIQELGRWAVAKHASQANDGLRFDRVTHGKEQMVSGMNYNLVLDTTDANGVTAAYKAFVYEHWTHARKLMSFSALN